MNGLDNMALREFLAAVHVAAVTAAVNHAARPGVLREVIAATGYLAQGPLDATALRDQTRALRAATGFTPSVPELGVPAGALLTARAGVVGAL